MESFFTQRLSLVVISSLALCFLLTPIFSRLARKRGLVAHPWRKNLSHKTIPLGGGPALFLSFALPAALLMPLNRELIGFFLGAALIFFTGYLDDQRPLTPKAKLIAQLFCALCFLLFGGRYYLTGHSLPDFLWTILWLVLLTNSLNLLDNMDGITAGVTIAASLSFFALAYATNTPTLGILSAALASPCLAFLIYNFPPAKVFMGDSGSLFLGYTLAGLGAFSTEAMTKATAPAAPFTPFVPLVPIVILALPLLDTTFVTITRLKRMVSPLAGGHDHTTHRLASLGLSDRAVAGCFLILSLALGADALYLLYAPPSSAGFVLLGTGLLLLALGCLLALVPIPTD